MSEKSDKFWFRYLGEPHVSLESLIEEDKKRANSKQALGRLDIPPEVDPPPGFRIIYDPVEALELRVRYTTKLSLAEQRARLYHMLTQILGTSAPPDSPVYEEPPPS